MVTSSRAGPAGVGAAEWLEKARSHLRKADPALARLIADRALHLPRILDRELRPYGIGVNAVAPQLIDTASNRASLPADVIAHAVARGDRRSDRVPSQRGGSARERSDPAGVRGLATRPGAGRIRITMIRR